MSANAQVKSFIDRVLRLKEEQDALAQDIRDIYAEAKSSGYDKTQLGNVVAHLRKVEKRGADTIAEQSEIFDMYLAAYQGSHTHAPARVRENIEEFEPDQTFKSTAGANGAGKTDVTAGETATDHPGSSSGRTPDFESGDGGSNPSLGTTRKPLRPHCQRPDQCGGYGAKHCYSCAKAAEVEAA